jgi:hypothetical protein
MADLHHENTRNYSRFSPLRRFRAGLLVKSNLNAGSNVSTSVSATFARV